MCAVLLSCVEQVDEIRFVDPGTIQAGKILMRKHDIISDLPFDRRAGLWFDHHESSKPREEREFEGAFELAPSAARVIFNHYENPFLDKYKDALLEVDKIDSGSVSKEQVENPTGWFLLSNTLESSAEKSEDDSYREYVIKLIKKNPDIDAILADAKVSARVKNVKADFDLFRKILLENTVMVGKVAYSDMRSRSNLPKGNNYLVYSLFPDAVTSVRIMPEREDKNNIKISVGHNIYGKKSEFDVGAAMRKLGGGGHKPVGGATVKKEEAEAVAKKLIDDINAFEEKN